MKLMNINQKHAFMFKRNKAILDSIYDLRRRSYILKYWKIFPFELRNHIKGSIYHDMGRDVRAMLDIFTDPIGKSSNYDRKDLQKLNRILGHRVAKHLSIKTAKPLAQLFERSFHVSDPFGSYIKLMTHSGRPVNLLHLNQHAVDSRDQCIADDLIDKPACHFLGIHKNIDSMSMNDFDHVASYWDANHYVPVFVQKIDQHEISQGTLNGIPIANIYDFYHLIDERYDINGYVVECENSIFD